MTEYIDKAEFLQKLLSRPKVTLQTPKARKVQMMDEEGCHKKPKGELADEIQFGEGPCFLLAANLVRSFKTF